MFAAKNRYWTVVSLLGTLAVISLVWVGVSEPAPPLDGMRLLLLVVYAALLTLAQVFPVRLGEQTISLSFGIELPLFLQFGAVFASVLVSVTWVLGNVIMGRTVTLRRLAGNVSMFLLMTTLAASVYGLLGGRVPIHLSYDLYPVLAPLVVFVAVHFAVNYFVAMSLTHLEGRRDSWLMGLRWDLSSLLAECVIALLFIIMQHFFGAAAFVYISVPFAGLIYIFNLYSNLVLANRQLTIISDLTMKLNTQLREDEVFKELLEGISHLVRMTACYIFIPDAHDVLVPYAVKGATQEMETQMLRMRVERGAGVTGTAYDLGKPLVHNIPKDVLVEKESVFRAPTPGKSILAVPLCYRDQELGMLTLTHVEKRAYSSRDLEMVQILANQAAITLWNARRFAQTEEQSYVDQLTELYNYRYFETVIEQVCREADRSGSSLALLVIDLDHFKRINDIYGHLVGNEVLKQMARIIKEGVREGDIVCRYGGEEFTVILPNATIDVALQIAERLRGFIAESPIVLPPNGKMTVLPIHMTASLGAAIYPDMADSSLTLLRHADRAMYVGSKQRGRNRVAVYEK
ncbi:MAG: sensor domain-containing diguanylate cyclase [Bacilli bacterium]